MPAPNKPTLLSAALAWYEAQGWATRMPHKLDPEHDLVMAIRAEREAGEVSPEPAGHRVAALLAAVEAKRAEAANEAAKGLASSYRSDQASHREAWTEALSLITAHLGTPSPLDAPAEPDVVDPIDPSDMIPEGELDSIGAILRLRQYPAPVLAAVAEVLVLSATEVVPSSVETIGDYAMVAREILYDMSGTMTHKRALFVKAARVLLAGVQACDALPAVDAPAPVCAERMRQWNALDPYDRNHSPTYRISCTKDNGGCGALPGWPCAPTAPAPAAKGGQ